MRCAVGQVGGLLLGLARQSVTLAGEFCHLLGQSIALGLDHLTSGSQLDGLAPGLHQAALDLGAGLGGCALDLGGNSSRQCLRQFRRSGSRHRASLAPGSQMFVNGIRTAGAQTLADRADSRLLPFANQRISGGGDLLKRNAFTCHTRLLSYFVPYKTYQYRYDT